VNLETPSEDVGALAYGRAARFCDGSRMSGDVQVRFCEGLGVRLPGPTHLAALCATESQAKEALRRIGLVIKQIGLTLHPDKTRLVDLRNGKGSFVFLGCTIRKRRIIQRSPRLRFMQRWPSPKATQRLRLRDRVREITGPSAAGKTSSKRLGN